MVGSRATSKNRDWDYASIGFISAPQTMHPEDAYSLGVLWQSTWPDTHPRTAPQGYNFALCRGWHDPYSSLSSPLESKYHIQNHLTRSPTLTSRYVQGVWFAAGVSLTQEENYYMGVCFKVFYHSRAPPVAYCSTSRSSKGEQVNATHGVREVHALHVRVRHTHP